jgi:hypothetical protein
MKTIKLTFTALIFILTSVSCEKDTEFAYDIDLLIDIQWGFPEVQEGSISYLGPTPVVFDDNGRVTFGGAGFDFWEVRSSRSLLISERALIWEILDLNEERLYVEVLRYPGGQFLARGILYPVN